MFLIWASERDKAERETRTSVHYDLYDDVRSKRFSNIVNTGLNFLEKKNKIN